MTLLDSFWWVWGNNSSKQCQIQVRFWPSGVLIIVQMYESQIFTETWHTLNLSFNVDLNLPVEDDKSQK